MNRGFTVSFGSLTPNRIIRRQRTVFGLQMFLTFVRNIFFRRKCERYRNFSKDNILTVSYTEAIINFNARLIKSSLKADYILFEKRDNGYNHFCVAMDSNGKRYAESFFYNPGDLYLRGQQIVKIRKIEIYDAFDNLYLEDTLIK